MEYAINALVGILTPILSALGAWWMAKLRVKKALDACVAAKEACNDEVHKLEDTIGMLKIAVIADKAEILALQNALEAHKNAS